VGCHLSNVWRKSEKVGSSTPEFAVDFSDAKNYMKVIEALVPNPLLVCAESIVWIRLGDQFFILDQ